MLIDSIHYPLLTCFKYKQKIQFIQISSWKREDFLNSLSDVHEYLFRCKPKFKFFKVQFAVRNLRACQLVFILYHLKLSCLFCTFNGSLHYRHFATSDTGCLENIGSPRNTELPDADIVHHMKPIHCIFIEVFQVLGHCQGLGGK